MSGATRCPKCGYDWVPFSAQQAASRVCLGCRARPRLAVPEPAKASKEQQPVVPAQHEAASRSVSWQPYAAIGAALALFVLFSVVVLGATLAYGRLRPLPANADYASSTSTPEVAVAVPSQPARVDELPTIVAAHDEAQHEPMIDEPSLPTVARFDAPAPEPQCTSARHGTAIEFVSSPADAAKQALQERKLVFVLHISGNFEEAKFT